MGGMRDERMDGSKDGWKAVRDTPRGVDCAAWVPGSQTQRAVIFLAGASG